MAVEEIDYNMQRSLLSEISLLLTAFEFIDLCRVGALHTLKFYQVIAHHLCVRIEMI